MCFLLEGDVNKCWLVLLYWGCVLLLFVFVLGLIDVFGIIEVIFGVIGLLLGVIGVGNLVYYLL